MASMKNIAVLIALTVSWEVHAKEKTGQPNKPIIYNHVSQPSADDKAVKALYGAKFKVVDFGDDRRYIRSTCTSRVIPQPQYSESGRLLRGSVRVAVIVTPQGRVIEPLILHSTEPRLNPIILKTITHWRGTAAKLDGKSISIVLSQDFTFR